MQPARRERRRPRRREEPNWVTPERWIAHHDRGFQRRGQEPNDNEHQARTGTPKTISKAQRQLGTPEPRMPAHHEQVRPERLWPHETARQRWPGEWGCLRPRRLAQCWHWETLERRKPTHHERGRANRRRPNVGIGRPHGNDGQLKCDWGRPRPRRVAQRRRLDIPEQRRPAHRERGPPRRRKMNYAGPTSALGDRTTTTASPMRMGTPKIMPTSPTLAFGDPATSTKASSTQTGLPKTMPTTPMPMMRKPRLPNKFVTTVRGIRGGFCRREAGNNDEVWPGGGHYFVAYLILLCTVFTAEMQGVYYK